MASGVCLRARHYAAVSAVAASTSALLAISDRHRQKHRLHQWQLNRPALLRHGTVRCDGIIEGCKQAISTSHRATFVMKNPDVVDDDYLMSKPLGDGGYSTVYKAVHKRTGIGRAVKRMDKERTNDTQFEAEVRALITLDHPNIVKVIEYFEDKDNFHLVMQLCDGEDLYECIASTAENDIPGLPEAKAAALFRQCLLAVSGCHFKGVIHRDLKPENFIHEPQTGFIKLIDFGLCCNTKVQESEAAGTGCYMAPECIKDNHTADDSQDLWSLGCILYVMLTCEYCPEGNEIHEDPDCLERHFKNSARYQALSPNAKDLIQRLMKVEPSERIDIQAALKHPFLAGTEDKNERQRRFAWAFMQLPWKMKQFAEAPLMKKLAGECIVLLASASSLTPGLQMEFDKARLLFRSLDPEGTGSVSEAELRERLVKEGVRPPSDFGDIFKACLATSFGSGYAKRTGEMDYSVFVACQMMDVLWPEILYREAFYILDRSRNGVIETEELLMLVQAGKSDPLPKSVDAEARELGYINYDRFLDTMKPSEGTLPHRLRGVIKGFIFGS